MPVFTVRPLQGELLFLTSDPPDRIRDTLPIVPFTPRNERPQRFENLFFTESQDQVFQIILNFSGDWCARFGRNACFRNAVFTVRGSCGARPTQPSSGDFGRSHAFVTLLSCTTAFLSHAAPVDAVGQAALLRIETSRAAACFAPSYSLCLLLIAVLPPSQSAILHALGLTS